MALDRIVEQPTESSPYVSLPEQAIMCPWPGLTLPHRVWTSVLQSRSGVEHP